jgi:hypothetical protein
VTVTEESRRKALVVGAIGSPKRISEEQHREF